MPPVSLKSIAAIAAALSIPVTAASPPQPGTPFKPLRDEVRATRAVVAAGRTFTADAGVRILTARGNAIDAGVAAIFAAAVVEISHFGLGGEAPIIL